MKIATHNSATGEQGRGFISWLVTPFSKCQSKTLIEQYDAGCRYFDLRVRVKLGEWVFAHGLWESKKSAFKLLDELDRHAYKCGEKCYISLTYEGDSECILVFDSIVADRFSWVVVTEVNVKKPTWRCLITHNSVPVKQAFLPLDGSTWHTYLPIPWLWDKIYYNRVNFSNEHFTMVDFL